MYISYEQLCTPIYLGLFFSFSPCFRQQNLRCFSSWIELSSVHSTFLKPFAAASLLYSSAHSNRFILFDSRMSWQYELLRNVQPSAVLQRNIVFLEITCPRTVSIWCSCMAVVSSSSHIFSSTNLFTSSVIFDLLPLPGRRAIHREILYFFRNCIFQLC